MPHLAANLTMMFTEWPFLDRFGAAADAGFDAVEFLFPYEHPIDVIVSRLTSHKLTPALFNLPPGDWHGGDRGLAALPERAAEFRASVDLAAAYAQATGVKSLHMMSGLSSRSSKAHCDAYRRAVEFALDRLAPLGVTVLLEPINSRDVPGYFLNDFSYAHAFIQHLDHPNLKLQFDIYHRQILHGDVTRALEAMLPIIGHVQIAAVPDRHEPGSGELRDDFLMDLLDQSGYRGYVGCEYRPQSGTLEGLSWAARHLRRPSQARPPGVCK